MLHYNTRHVSNSTMLIFRRTNCVTAASGIVTLCKRPYSMPTESGHISQTAHFNKWHSTLLHVSIHKESSSGSSQKNTKNTPVFSRCSLTL